MEAILIAKALVDKIFQADMLNLMGMVDKVVKILVETLICKLLMTQTIKVRNNQAMKAMVVTVLVANLSTLRMLVMNMVTVAMDSTRLKLFL